MTRQEIIANAKSLVNDYPNIALQWATGLGKSRCAIELTKNVSSNPKVLLVVYEIAHKKNWEEEFKKWGTFKNLTVICYASLKNYINTEWDAVIWDEAHHLRSELKSSILATIKSKHHFFLSATFPNGLLDYLGIMIKSKIVKYTISLDSAIKANIIPEPTVYMVKLFLNSMERNQEIVEEWGKSALRKEFIVNYPDRWKYKKNKRTYPNVRLVIKCTELEKYRYLCEQVDYWKKRYMIERYSHIKNKWLQYGSQRKKYLGELKTPYVKELIKKLRDKRFICFCTSIAQADSLNSQNSIHSKMNNPGAVIENFNKHNINSLFACQMITEGQNLNDIEASIIVQLDGQELRYIQKTGRVLRAENPIQFVLYYENTRDSEYLTNALTVMDKNYVKSMTMMELKNLEL